MSVVEITFFFVLLAFATSILIVFPPGSLAGGCGCAPLWTPFGESCYRYFTYKNITWPEAELVCNGFTVPCSDGPAEVTLGHLTSVHSKEEMTFLVALYESIRDKQRTSSYSRVWIGLHDVTTESAFEWSDGSNLSYTYWSSSQPNNYQNRNQDCVSFSHDDPRHGWNDLACDGAFIAVESFICKLPKW